MILFLNDWKKYPNAIIHYETKNTSFIRLAEIYYKLNVKNCAFHLALLQPELKDIDPHDNNLPLEVKAKVLYECKNNPWYVIREVIKIPVPGSLNPIPFKADRMNIALYWLFFNHITTLVAILRQTGKTTSLMSLVVGLLNFWVTNTSINLLTKSDSLKTETLSKLKAIYEELPDYLNFSTKKDIFNSDEVKLKDLDNSFKGNLSSASPKQAEKVGRGFTSPINIIDEAAFIENVSIAMGAMLMSGNAAREYARLNNKPYGTILATTTGDIDDREGRYIYNLANSATLWNESFYDVENINELNEIILKNCNISTNKIKSPIVYISFSHRQLGYDDEWLQRRLQENISTPENLARDLFNQWTSGNSQSPIPKQYINALRENTKEDSISEFYSPYNYLLNWYITPEEIENRINNKINFIIGIDTSDAAGRDDVAFVVRDSSTGEIICTATFNELNLITLADFFVSFLLKYTNSVMIIERRSSASAIIDYMIQKLLYYEINPFTRLYNTIFQNKEQYKEQFEEIMKAKYYNEDIFIKYKKHIGFTTSGSGITSRSELYSTTLLNMLKYTSTITYDKKLISQISSLVIKNNRIDHPEDGNDDLVIAALLSYWLLINGKNLHHYNINTSNILKNNTIYLNEKYSSLEEESVTEEIQEKENLLNELVEQYKNERNPFILNTLEIKIAKLISERSNINNNISVQSFIDELKATKKLKFKN